MSGNQEMLLSPEMLMQMGMFPLKTLLVIDSGRELGSLIYRALSDSFKDIWLVASLDEARELLEKHDIKYLISNYFLGETAPNGYQVVSTLRSEFESLERCLVITDADVTGGEMPGEVDASLCMTLSPHEIADVLIQGGK